MAESTTSDTGVTFEDIDGELPAHVDRGAIKRMRAVARLLDDGIRVPGTEFRFGLDPIVGILPGAGDTAASAVSLYIVFESARQGVRPPTLVRMLANIAVDTVVGSIPVLGTVFDAFWKANSKNLELAFEDLAVEESPEDVDPVTIDV